MLLLDGSLLIYLLTQRDRSGFGVLGLSEVLLHWNKQVFDHWYAPRLSEQLLPVDSETDWRRRYNELENRRVYTTTTVQHFNIHLTVDSTEL
jgi:hypothetical protein